MATLKRGMIVDVDWGEMSPPDHRNGTIRPCVVVTNDVYNERVPVIQVVPMTPWNPKKAQIATNVEILPSTASGLPEQMIADCLQTRPIVPHSCIIKVRGQATAHTMNAINKALKLVFELQNE